MPLVEKNCDDANQSKHCACLGACDMMRVRENMFPDGQLMGSWGGRNGAKARVSNVPAAKWILMSGFGMPGSRVSKLGSLVPNRVHIVVNDKRRLLYHDCSHHVQTLLLNAANACVHIA